LEFSRHSTEKENEDDIFNKIIDNLNKYHPGKDFSLVHTAYKIAKDAHKDQFRKSGDKYIVHPLHVALILTQLELDIETIVAGILHDVIEDTRYSYEDIKNIFGQEIADLVDGVTKLDKIKYTSREEFQAENYRKMFIAMAKDIRVILIKMADRLHNMQTLKYQSSEKQKKISQETIDIYAPIAHRLGISKVRYQLEDLAFFYLDHDEYEFISQKVNLHRSERVKRVEKIIDAIKTNLVKYKIEARVEGRAKHFFSIYKKMLTKHKTFEQIYDLFAVRAIVKTVTQCYMVLGIIHDMYRPIPGRFKDYIAMPKSNMYQSLHSTLIGPYGEPFEIQIRTEQMHRVAEYGIATHWKYKEGKSNEHLNSEEQKLAWLKQILEWQKEYNDSHDYLDAIKCDLNIYQAHVYCFTPQGQVLSLPGGSTPIDFAYLIHSAVGNKMVGARVNSKIVTLNYVLRTGDRVEIITSKHSHGPNLSWLKIAKTSHARNKINQWFKQENKSQNIQKGKCLLEKESKQKGIALNDLLENKIMQEVLDKYKFNSWDTLCAAVGHGAIKAHNIINKLYIYYSLKNKNLKSEVLEKKFEVNKNESKYTDSNVIVINGLGDIRARFSKCCNPVPGDDIIGFITRGRGVSVHRVDCKNIINIDEANKNRLIPACWHDNKKTSNKYYSEVKVFSDKTTNILQHIINLLTNEKVNIKSINSHTTKKNLIFNIGIEVENTKQLNMICSKLLRLNGIYDIKRNEK
jgi:GTP pyrophosphokinase